MPLLSDRLPEGVELFDHGQLQNDFSNEFGALDEESTQQEFKDALLAVLGDDGHSILGDLGGGPDIDRADIVLGYFDPLAGEIEFQFKLADSLVVPALSLEGVAQLGISFLPLEVKSDVQVELNLSYESEPIQVGSLAGVNSFDFSGAEDQFLFEAEVSLAGEDENTPASFTANFGVFGVRDGSDGGVTAMDNGSTVGVALSVDFDTDDSLGIVNTTITPSAPNIDLDWTFTASANENLPSIAFDLEWETAGETWGGNDFQIRDFRIGLGGVLSKFIKPVLENIKPILDPIDMVVGYADEPIPVVDALLGGDDPYTLLTLLEDLDKAGLIPAQYSAIVTIVSEAIRIIGFINEFEVQGNEVFFVLGDYQITDSNLRGRQAGGLSGWSGGSMSDVSVERLDGSPDLIGELTNKLDSLGLGASEGAQRLLDAITAKPGVSFEIPLLDNPLSLVYLAFGQADRIDIVRVDVSFFNPADTEIRIPYQLPTAPIGGDLILDAKPIVNIQIGYDAVGIVSAVFHRSPIKLLDGFYVAPSANPPPLSAVLSGRDRVPIGASLGTKASASIGFDIGVFNAGVRGKVNADFAIEVPTPAIYGGEKLRLTDNLGEVLFEVNGDIEGALTFEYKVGFKIGGRCLCYKREIPFVDRSFSFAANAIYNPFYIAPEERIFAEQIGNRLFLYMGDFIDLNRNGEQDPSESEIERAIGTDEEDEAFFVSQEERDGVTTYIVDFGGLIHEIPDPNGTIEVIEAHAGAGNDAIIIDESVTADAWLVGGGGDDTLLYGGTGIATIFGGDDNDQIASSGMQNFLSGGDGEDDVTGSSRPGAIGNWIFGGDDEDIIIGGTGENFLFGEAGDDSLTGMEGTTEFDGGFGRDSIFGGAGENTFHNTPQDEIHAGEGLNILLVPSSTHTTKVFWSAGDADLTMFPRVDVTPGEPPSKYLVNTDLSIFGDDSDEAYDLLTLHDPNAPYPADYNVVAANGKSITVINAANISIDAAGGQDVVRLLGGNPTRLGTVAVNGSDNLDSDQDADEIYVVGTPNDDELFVSAHDGFIRAETDLDRPPHDPDGSVDEENHEFVVEWGAAMVVEGLSYRVTAMVNPEDLLQLDTFEGNDSVWVYSNTGTLNINTHDGDDTSAFFVDELGRTDYVFAPDSLIPDQVTGAPVAGYFGEINFDGGTDFSAVSVGGQRGARPDQFHLTDSRIWTDHISVNYAGDQFLWTHMLGSQADDIFRVLNTRPDALNLLSGQDGNDIARIHQEQELNGILGGVLYDGESGVNELILDDRGTTVGNSNIELIGNAVNGLAGPSDETTISGFNTTLRLLTSNSPSLDETISINGPLLPFEINGGFGNEQFHVHSMSNIGTIRGQGGNDEVHLSGDLDAITSTLTFLGGGGVDRLDINDSEGLVGQTYNLSGNTFRRGNGLEVKFDQYLDTFELKATSRDDLFRVVSPSPDPIPFRIDLAGGQDVVFGPNEVSDWRIRDLNSVRFGENVEFLGTEEVVGGNAVDNFIVLPGALQPDSTPVTVNGGVGSSIDVLTTPSSVRAEVSLEDGTINDVLSFSGVERLRGNHHNDRLTGKNVENVWRVSGSNSGSVQTAGQSDTITFTNFESLLGGTETDRFLLQEGGSISGPINGRQGRDWIDYRNRTSGVFVDLSGDLATDIGTPVSIENVHGGQGRDVIVGDEKRNILRGEASDDLLVGMAGNDLMFGDEGRDLMIGGVGPDQLYGFSGEDILIGGWTDYDSSASDLNTLSEIWSNPNSVFEVRVEQLRDGKGGVALSKETVTDDGQVDQLFGQGDMDWLWEGVGDELVQDGRTAGPTLNSSQSSSAADQQLAALASGVFVAVDSTSDEILFAQDRFPSEAGLDTELGNLESFSWTNASNRFDVNDDDAITPLDALLIINFLNRSSGLLPELSQQPSEFLDVSQDGHATPLDALAVINQLNSNSTAFPIDLAMDSSFSNTKRKSS